MLLVLEHQLSRFHILMQILNLMLATDKKELLLEPVVAFQEEKLKLVDLMANFFPHFVYILTCTTVLLV